ncbi:hypothetical protein EsVE80_16050 [Enterococcus saigonensis]|uniref:Uncharacterized protein n=1 Tax=Enterococcus saigonensis TaxID=1805431 RepID=A0A679IJ17_9ENTE|nr:hypothetical protein [Enterococcus saigonensis]BCA86082.1 hypothetical protein EsVE80_16050 [Enterococcus saigonensis]
MNQKNQLQTDLTKDDLRYFTAFVNVPLSQTEDSDFQQFKDAIAKKQVNIEVTGKLAFMLLISIVPLFPFIRSSKMIASVLAAGDDGNSAELMMKLAKRNNDAHRIAKEMYTSLALVGNAVIRLSGRTINILAHDYNVTYSGDVRQRDFKFIFEAKTLPSEISNDK